MLPPPSFASCSLKLAQQNRRSLRLATLSTRMMNQAAPEHDALEAQPYVQTNQPPARRS
jgi:hypothetical protein